MSDISKWFREEIFWWRTIASLTWFILLLPLIAISYIGLVSLSIFHPVTAIYDFLTTLLSFGTWFYFLLYVGGSSLAAVIGWKCFTVTHSVYSTRLALVWSMTNPDCIVYTIGHVLIGSFSSWILTNLVSGRYNGLTTTCSSDDVDQSKACLNEYHLFLVLAGSFIGFCYGVTFFLHNVNCIKFPHIIQPKLFQVKSGSLRQLYNSTLTSLRVLFCYYILFFLFGSVPKRWFLTALQLQQGEIKLNSIYGLIDVELLWRTGIHIFIIHFTWNFSAMLYKIFNSEYYKFPVINDFDVNKSHCLPDALTQDTDLLVKYLGFLDLRQISKHSLNRRSEVFSLSQPGGHPHVWKAVVQECLKILQDLTSSLTNYNNTYMVNGTSTSTKGPSIERPQLFSPMVSSVQSPYVDQSKFRNIDSLTPSYGQKPPSYTQQQTPATKQDAFVEKSKPDTQPFIEMLLSKIKKKPVFSYLLDDIPDTESRKLFADGQLYIWVVEAIASLTACSYTEDQYGIVQQWLPDIISSLITLQEALDKHFKLSTNLARRPIRGASDNAVIGLRSSLKHSLKTAIYTITTTFKQNLTDISISSEVRRRLTMFAECKE